MRLKALCGLIAAAAVSSSFAAGFVDERSSAKAPQGAAIASVGGLAGDFALKEWAQSAPPSAEGGVALSLAIIRLLPPNKPAVEIDAPSAIIDTPVSWSPGVTRRQALQEIAARNNLNISIEGRTVTVRPAASSVVVAGPEPSTQGAASVPVLGAPRWEAGTSDGTIRKVVEKWAAIAGWTFGLEQWGADRDLPIMAKIKFEGDFRGAIRSLLSTTELTDMPLQPCFYSNNVLRVVPRPEVCDRTAVSDKQ